MIKKLPTLSKVDSIDSPFTFFLPLLNSKEQMGQRPSLICTRKALLGSWDQAGNRVTPQDQRNRGLPNPPRRRSQLVTRNTHAQSAQIGPRTCCQLCPISECSEQASSKVLLYGGHSPGAEPGKFTGALISSWVACEETEGR